MQIIYNDKELNVNDNTTIKELLKEEIEKSKIPIIGAKFNNEYQRLDYEITQDCKVSLVDIASKGGMKIYRRTLIYIMGKAFQEVCPEALLTVNYQLSHSMFCEIDNMETTQEILDKVYVKMEEIISKNMF